MKSAKKAIMKGLCHGAKPSTKKPGMKKKGASAVSDAIKSGLTTLTKGGPAVTGGTGENLGITGGARGGKPAPGQGVW